MQVGSHQGMGTVGRMEGRQHKLGVLKGHQGILSSRSCQICPCHLYIYGARIRMVGPVRAQKEEPNTGKGQVKVLA